MAGQAFNPVQFIRDKRSGRIHASETIHAAINAYANGDLPDYQMSAWLMAAFLNGLNDDEGFALTEAMLHSGAVMDLSDVPGIKVDKHSTGGVGDKVSIILAPLVAACGVPVPMISGRGLGHSGGTLDKLEAIPGFRTLLSPDEFKRQLAEIGVVMIGQTDEIAPADRKLYALRDVTATVEAVPLIAASILSKKLAEGIDALVLDVKFGSGAFMKTESTARVLGRTLVRLGTHFGKDTVALLTDMNTPLGRSIGNWPETAEAIRCLQGEDVPDVMELTTALAAEMLVLGGAADNIETGRLRARDAVASGAAFEKLVELVSRQGGDATVIQDPDRRFGAEPVADVLAPQDAGPFVVGADAYALGKTATLMGAGRTKMDDRVDPTAGISMLKRPGDPVRPGDVLACLHTKKTDLVPVFQREVVAAFSFGDCSALMPPLIVDRLTGHPASDGNAERVTPHLDKRNS